MAGRSVRAEAMAKTMPIAVTGPSVLFDFRSDRVSVSSPAMTVPPEATIGSTEPLRAFQQACQAS